MHQKTDVWYLQALYMEPKSLRLFEPNYLEHDSCWEEKEGAGLVR